MSDVDELARLLQRPDFPVAQHRAVVTAVNTTAKTCTLNYAGSTVAGVPYYEGLTIANDDVVDFVIVGVAPRVIGVIQ